MEYTIGVDIGTSSTKTVAFSRKGELLSFKRVEYPLISPEPSIQEQDPNEIFSAICVGIKFLIEEMEAQPAAIGFSSAMHSLIALDGKGNLLTNCITWADTRAQGLAEKLNNSSLGTAIYNATGTPIHPMSPLLKIRWLKEMEPNVFGQTSIFLGIKEYIIFRLFGAFVMDYSIASATGLFNIHRLDWEPKALEYSGINAGNLPKPVAPTFNLSGLDADLAMELGLDKNTPFVIGASDGCLANLGNGVIKRGIASVTIGTSGAIRSFCTGPLIDKQQRTFCYLLDLEHYIIGGATNNGGVIYDWFQEVFSDLDTQEIQRIPVGSDQLLFLPYLLGERAPLWDASAKGAFLGIQKRHTQEHFLRAVLEGICFNIKAIIEPLEELSDTIDTVYASGGFAKSKYWVQLLADVLGKKIVIQSSPQASALGACIQTMIAIGWYTDYEEFPFQMEGEQTFIPNSNAITIYKERFKIFKALYKALQNIHLDRT